MKCDIVVGDVHGCSGELQEMVEVLARDGFLSSGSHLVFLGDYVDRGPDSRGTIEYLLRLRNDHDCTFLLGNHDQTFLWHLASSGGLQPVNGEFETVVSYGEGTIARQDLEEFLRCAGPGVSLGEACRGAGRRKDSDARFNIPDSHLEFLNNLLPYHDSGRAFVSHGGVKSEFGTLEAALRPEARQRILTAHGEPDAYLRVPGKLQVIGHKKRQDLVMTDWVCMIDTGVAMGNFLSALVMPDGWSSVKDMVVRQVKAKRNWYWEACEEYRKHLSTEMRWVMQPPFRPPGMRSPGR